MKEMRTLANTCIVLGVTGSIAVVEVVRIIHALRRRGAIVQGVMSKAACELIGPDVITYATGRPTIIRCSGMVEHIHYCGESGCAHLLLIAPCTANTISKIALGIDDTPVTTFATTAIGRRMPIVVAPAMHETMYRHPAIAEHITRLLSWGIDIVEPRIEEGKAKIADIDVITLHVERSLMGNPLKGKRVLITSGPCAERIDDIRILTTRSTGLMGRALALQAFRLGAEVTVVHSDSFPSIKNVYVTSAREMRNAVHRLCTEEHFDYYISAAAISDFAPIQIQGKLPSGAPLDIHLEPLPKLLTEVVGQYHPTTVAFKLESLDTKRAYQMVKEGVTMVVVDSPAEMGTVEGTFTIITSSDEQKVQGSKDEVAATIWQKLL